MYLNKSENKVAIAMSGGVDSSTAALLLIEQGYDVIGLTGIMHEDTSADLAAKNAEMICKILGIEHHAIDLRSTFKEKVIEYYENSYKVGLTPNPCVACNVNIKWGQLKEFAEKKLGASYYATGHYAKKIFENGQYKLTRAKDAKKDQLYMLFDLKQENIANTLFPLADLTKQEVKELAIKHNLPCAASKESQDICFIPHPDTTKKYLTRKFGEKPGNIVDVSTNKILGKHSGTFNYTIGQRRGIGIAASQPLYVVGINHESNTVYVGFEENLYKSELIVSALNIQLQEFKNKEFDALVKIRYNTTAKPARIIPLESDSTKIVFESPVSGITPGQAAVIYDQDNNYLIGGGWIR